MKIFNSSNNTKLLKDGFIYTLSGIINKAIPFLFLPIMTSYLTPSDYGLFNNFTLLVHIISLLLVFGSHQALSVNYYKNSKEEIGTYIENILILVFFLFLFLLLTGALCQTIILQYLKLSFKFVVLALFSSLFTFFNGLQLLLFRLDRQPIKFGFYQNAMTLLNFTMGIIFVVLLLLNWQGRVFSLIITSGVFSIISFVLIHKKYNLKFRYNKSILKDIINFGLPLLPHSLGAWLNVNVAKIILTNALGLAENGIYSIAIQISFLLKVLVDAFGLTYAPYFYKKLSSIKENEKVLVVKNSYVIFIVLLSLAFIINFAAQAFLPYYITNPSYHEALQYLLILLLSYAFTGMYMIVSYYITYSKRTLKLSKVTLPMSLFYLVLCYFLVQWDGIYGATLALLVSNVLTFAFTWRQAQKVYPMPWFSFNKL